MAKVVYNGCYGGFSVSRTGLEWMAARGHEGAKAEIVSLDEMNRQRGRVAYDSGGREFSRTDPTLIACIEAIGDAANGSHADLTIATVKGRRYRIDEYDGSESVQEPDDVEWTEIPDDVSPNTERSPT